MCATDLTDCNYYIFRI